MRWIYAPVSRSMPLAMPTSPAPPIPIFSRCWRLCRRNLLGSTNAFVAKLNAAGSALVYSTYLGGSNIDNATAIAVDSTGDGLCNGRHRFDRFSNHPGGGPECTEGSIQRFRRQALGDGERFGVLHADRRFGFRCWNVDRNRRRRAQPSLAVIHRRSTFPPSTRSKRFRECSTLSARYWIPNGVSLVFSSYFGGSGDDRGYAVVAAPVNEMVLAGITSSANFPVVSGVQAALSVAPDAFIMEVAYIAIAGIPAANSVSPSSGSGTSQTFALQYSDTAGAENLQQMSVYFNATLANPAINSCQLYYNLSTNQLNLLNDAGTAGQAATLGTAAHVSRTASAR